MKIRIRDFVIKIRLSFFLLIAVLAALGMIGQFFIVIMLVFLHELCHIAAAKYFGCKCTAIEISPIGMCAEAELECLSLCQKTIVVLAGPVFNIAAGIATGSGISIALGIFNLLPIYPLDGGRLLNLYLGYMAGTLRANRYVSTVSMFFCILLVILGVVQSVLFVGNISLLIIGIYVLRLNKKRTQLVAYSFYKTLIHKPNNKILRTRCITVNKNTKLKTIIYRLGTDYYTMLYIRDDEGIKTVSEDCVQDFILHKGIDYHAMDLI